jgi:hypothetical protein
MESLFTALIIFFSLMAIPLVLITIAFLILVVIDIFKE